MEKLAVGKKASKTFPQILWKNIRTRLPNHNYGRRFGFFYVLPIF